MIRLLGMVTLGLLRLLGLRPSPRPELPAHPAPLALPEHGTPEEGWVHLQEMPEAAPTFAPVTVAGGLAAVAVGTVSGAWFVVGVGVVLLIWGAALWLRAALKAGAAP